MTSTPAYDPNEFTTGIDASAWASLARDPQTPLMNRVIQGTYSPGSTFKIIASTAALEEGVITPATTFYCPGYLAVYNTVFHCTPAATGSWTCAARSRTRATSTSSRSGSASRSPGSRSGRSSWGSASRRASTCPHEASGLMPSPEWKMRLFKTPWYAGETVSVAIGQGQVNATPLQMARVAAVIANGGRLVRPHLARAAGGARSGARPAGDPPRDDRGRQGGDARGGGRGHGLARAALDASRCAARRARRRWWRSRGSRSRRTRSRCCPTAGSWRSPPPTTRGSPSPCSSSTGGAAASRRRPVARQILAHFFGLDRPAAPGAAGTADTEAED